MWMQDTVAIDVAKTAAPGLEFEQIALHKGDVRKPIFTAFADPIGEAAEA